MAERSQRKEINFALIRRFVQGIYIYNIDGVTAENYDQLKAALIRQFNLVPKRKVSAEKLKLPNWALMRMTCGLPPLPYNTILQLSQPIVIFNEFNK